MESLKTQTNVTCFSSLLDNNCISFKYIVKYFLPEQDILQKTKISNSYFFQNLKKKIPYFWEDGNENGNRTDPVA